MTNLPGPTNPSSPETAPVRPVEPRSLSGGPRAASDASNGPQAGAQPSGDPEAPQDRADTESPADAANGRQTGAEAQRQGTDGASGPRRLSAAELLLLAVAFERRRVRIRQGRPVPPPPDCPDCGAAPNGVAVSEGAWSLDEVRTIFRPCGHGFVANAEDAYEVSRQAAVIVDGEECRPAASGEGVDEMCLPAKPKEPCRHCGHGKRDHSDRRDRKPYPGMARRPWCHPCETACDYEPASGWCPSCGCGDLAPTGEHLAQAQRDADELRRRVDLAHQARRAKERQLDGIRHALIDVGAMAEDDPYSHADLEDVIRQAYGAPRPDGAVEHLVGPDEPGGVDTHGAER